MLDCISFDQFQERLYNDCLRNIDRYVFADNGSIYPKGPHHNMISPEAACREAYVLATSYSLSGDPLLAEKAETFLDYAGKSLIEKDGVVYWPAPVASLCSMGRWAREAFRAAQILHYQPAMQWLGKLLDSWPYDYENHRFVERFLEATHYPTSVHGFLTTYNMIAEGAADSWLVAFETGHESLVEKAKDTIINFILPGQGEDGIWNYSAPKTENMGLLNDGEKEFNYCLYLVYILSNLLEKTDAREVLKDPLSRAMDTLLDRFLNADGSIYTPVHWGWDHIYESTLLTSVICWRLYRYCGFSRYESITARGIHWLMKTDMGCGNLAGGMSCVGLYWNALFLDLLKDNFSVRGEFACKENVIQTLEMVEDKLSVLPADATHLALYFSLQVYATRYAIQRKIMRMKSELSESIEIPVYPHTVSVPLPWQFADTGYSGSVELGYDEDSLHIAVNCDGPMDNQPYENAFLFQGDGVLLTLQDIHGNKVVLSLALQNGSPVIYLYNNAIPFKGDLRLYLESEPQGWYLKDSQIELEKTGNVTRFSAVLKWNELGIHARKADCLMGGIAISRLTPYGCQYNQLGRTALEDKDFTYQGMFSFA